MHFPLEYLAVIIHAILLYTLSPLPSFFPSSFFVPSFVSSSSAASSFGRAVFLEEREGKNTLLKLIRHFYNALLVVGKRGREEQRLMGKDDVCGGWCPKSPLAHCH